MNKPHWLKSRRIVERIIIQGDLTLETPAGFGSGDEGTLVDIPLLLDPLENRALLTGASLAGALRSYLREREHGYGETGSSDSLYAKLFGVQEDGEGEQSMLIVHDSLGGKPGVELRDGVKIDPSTRTALDEKKFDVELIEAGTGFPVKMDLLVQEDRKEDLMRGLAVALQGLERSEIKLGVRKRRGFGQCRVTEWELYRYDLTRPEGLTSWLTNDPGVKQTGSGISDLLGATGTDLDRRNSFTVDAAFSLNGSLLIRSYGGDANAPDSVHLKSKRKYKRSERLVHVISGTALAGALRARALRIAGTAGTKEKARDVIDGLFGPDIEKNSSDDEPFASRLVTSETEIINPLDIVQSRVKIDRFTGGAYPTALFNEQPVFGQEGTGIRLKILIQQPTEVQIGLLLLLLKDLWTGDLPLGGESSVGRGRLRGENAALEYRLANEKPKQWTIREVKNELEIAGDQDKLEHFVSVFSGGMHR